jgi:hypothetical protein
MTSLLVVDREHTSLIIATLCTLHRNVPIEQIVLQGCGHEVLWRIQEKLFMFLQDPLDSRRASVGLGWHDGGRDRDGTAVTDE